MAELADELWARSLADLRLQMTRATFETWLAASRASWAVELGEHVLRVAVPNAYALDWLNHRLMGPIRRTLARQAGREVAVVFVVDGTSIAEEPGGEEEDEGEVLVEAVREEHVAAGRGSSLVWTDFYIKLKVAFRKRALRELKGAPLSVFLCLALHVDRDGVACPGVDTIMRETGYSRSVVCNALDSLVRSGIVAKRATFRGADEYVVRGYAWFGQEPAPALWEAEE